MLPAVTKTAAAMTNTINPDAMCKRKRADISGFGLVLMVYYLLDCFLFCIDRKAALLARQYAVFRFAGCCCMKDSTALPNWRVSSDETIYIKRSWFGWRVQHDHSCGRNGHYRVNLAAAIILLCHKLVAGIDLGV